MASHISLIKEGILEGDWSRVCLGFEQVTGEKLTAPTNENESVNLSFVADFLIRLGNEIKPNKFDESSKEEIKNLVDNRKAPKMTDIFVSSQLVDDNSVPQDPPTMYSTVPKNKKPRESNKIYVKCEDCNKDYEVSKDLVFSGGTSLCEECQKKRALRIRGNISA